MKITVQGMEEVFTSYESGRLQRSLKQYSLLPLSFIMKHSYIIRPTCRTYKKNCTQTKQEISGLLSNLH